jgi:ATP-dependent RNA helicase DDX27
MGRDICACAATGSGKTAAFMLPVLERLLFRPKRVPQVSLLITFSCSDTCPCSQPNSRAVCASLQCCTAIGTIHRHYIRPCCWRSAWGFSHVTFSGMALRVQEAELRTRPDVVIATPGRLVDHIQNTHSFDLSTIEVLKKSFSLYSFLRGIPPPIGLTFRSLFWMRQIVFLRLDLRRSLI